MKILVITQKIDSNDDVLGFMHGWIAQLGKECEEVTAIGLSVGVHQFDKNIKVYSLGKEGGVSRLKYLLNFYRIIIAEQKNYDAVFVHMNQVYVLLGAPIWKLTGKKIGLWFAHGSTPLTLKVALRLVDHVFTSTVSGFRLSSKKVHVIGQGIDTERFQLTTRTTKKDKPFQIIIVGRISPIKDYETLLRAVAQLTKKGRVLSLRIVGAPILERDYRYLNELKSLADMLEIAQIVRFCGGVPNGEIATMLVEADVFVNTSRTGSFDKAVGEAMATGIPVLTSNEAFTEVLGVHSADLMFAQSDDAVLTQKLEQLMDMSDSERATLGLALRVLIEEHHSLKNFIRKVLSYY